LNEVVISWPRQLVRCSFARATRGYNFIE